MRYPPKWFKDWFENFVFCQNKLSFHVTLHLGSRAGKILLFRKAATQMAHTAYVKGVKDERARQAKAKGG